MSVPAHRMMLIPILAGLIDTHHGGFETLLDVGCGELQQIWRQRWGDSYEGFDKRDSVGADYVGDACDLSRFETDSRDVVTAWSVIEHVTHPYTMLEEMKRVSRGTVMFTTDYMESDKNRDPTHLYSWTPKTFKQLVNMIHVDNTVYTANNMLIGVLRNCGANEN